MICASMQCHINYYLILYLSLLHFTAIRNMTYKHVMMCSVVMQYVTCVTMVAYVTSDLFFRLIIKLLYYVGLERCGTITGWAWKILRVNGLDQAGLNKHRARSGCAGP